MADDEAPLAGDDRTAEQQERIDKAMAAARDLEWHARSAAGAARDVLHDNGPGKEPGAYTTYEARDRAAHIPPAHKIEPER